MKSVILENEKRKFLHILDKAKKRRAQCFTQEEISSYLKVSRRTIQNFEKGIDFDFWLLCRYCDLVGININFWMK